MDQIDCTTFLQWCLPQLQMRWAGFRKVRRQVCKRIARRTGELGLSGFSGYKTYLETHNSEWPVLDSLCRVTISQFYRDKGTWEILHREILPELVRQAAARGETQLRCWSGGCCSGEEPYTLQILWQLVVQPAIDSGVRLKIIATDSDPVLLKRAENGCYPPGSLRDLPAEFLENAFQRRGECFILRDRFKTNIKFLRQDIRREMPEGLFHLIFCRNLVFTYFDEALQREILKIIWGKLISNGYLIIGAHEKLPEGASNFFLQEKPGYVYKKICT